MDEGRPARERRWRLLLLVAPLLVVGLWYGPRAVGYVAYHRVYSVPSGSMAPAILPGDRVMVDFGVARPGRGEIWLIKGPDSTIIKRVIGLPGETIEVEGGRVLIDGRPIPEPYLTGPTTSAMPPVRLGPDQYFLMGDDRAASFDSRAWGPVLEGQFLGRADYRCWPSGRIGPLR